MDCLERAEHIDKYRERCEKNEMNRRAREGHNYEFGYIGETAANFLRDSVEELPIVRENEIVILESDAENGYPHTRPHNLICLPASMCKEEPTSRSMKITLLHEAMHVHQRKYTAEWNRACMNAGWSEINSNIIPQEFQDRVRLNPDTIYTQFWAWDNYNVPLPIFKRTDTPRMDNVAIQWFDIRMNSLSHSPPPSYTATYGSEIGEHPYEIYADMLSKKFLSTSSVVLDYLKTI